MINIKVEQDKKIYSFVPGAWLDIQETAPDELSIKVKNVSNLFVIKNVIAQRIVASGKQKGTLKITVKNDNYKNR